MKKLLAPYRIQLAASALLAVLATASSLVPFYVVYEIARSAGDLAAVTADAILFWAAIAFGAILLKVILGGVSTVLSHNAAYNFISDLRRALVAKLDRVPLGYFSGRSLTDLKKVINEDAEQVEEALAHVVPDISAGLAVPICVAIALTFVDWRLALAALVMFPVVVVVYPLALAATKAQLTEYQAAMVDLRQAVVEYLQGMKVIRTFLGAGDVSTRFEAAIDRLAVALLRMSNAALLPGALLTVGLRVNVLVLLPVGGLLVLAGAIEVETFVLFLLMGLGVTASAQKLLMATGTFAMRMSTAGNRIGEILNADELPEPDHPAHIERFDIAFRDVAFSYQGRQTLKGVNFDVRPGEFTAIVGPSGAGKTTLARLMARFWDVDEGAVEIGDANVKAIGAARVIDHMAIILQDTWLTNDTLRANIRLARPDAKEQEVERAAELARVTPFAVELPHGLDSSVGEGGRFLSGGQRQRVAIARAILRDTPIVVMDEATSGLDAQNEVEVMDAIAALARGRTVIAIAHRLNTIRSADQIIVLADGQVVDKGRHDVLVDRCETYATLYKRFAESASWRLPPGADIVAPSPAVALKPHAAGLSSLNPRADATPREPVAPSSVVATAPSPGTAEGAARWRPDAGVLQSASAGGLGLGLFLRLLGPMRGEMLRQAVPLLILEGLFMGAPVIATALAVNDALAGTLTPERLWLYTGFIAICFFCQGTIDIIAHRVLWRIQTTAAPALQRTIGQRLRRVPLGLLQRRDTGALEALITQHVAELDFVAPTARMVRAVVAPLVGLVVLFLLDVRLALAAVATVPVFLAVVVLSDRTYRRVWDELLAARETLNARLFDSLQGLPTLRSLGLGAGNLPALAKAIEAHRNASLATISRLTPAVSVGLAILDLSFCVLLLIGGLLVAAGSLTLSTYLLFLVVGLVFYGPIGDAFELAADRRQQERTVLRVSDVLNLEVLGEPVAPKVPDRLDVALEHVGFAYDERRVLRDVSVALPAGKLHAFVGHSGSGKSTALALLARFWDVGEGAIKIGGVDLREISTQDRARLFAIVFQETFLFNDTVANNLRVGRPEATDDEMVGAAKAALCHDVIMRLDEGYGSSLGDGGARLSGGERQRIAIARAMLKDATIVLLDEATASIDPDTEAEIRQALSALCAGKTVVVVAHRLASVVAADQIVVFANGEIAGNGTHSDLLQTCRAYQDLWNAQSDAALDRELQHSSVPPPEPATVAKATGSRVR